MLIPVIENLYFSPVKSISFTSSESLIVKKNIGIKNDRIFNFILPENERTRRQDLKPYAYIRNGSIYAISRNTLKKNKSKIGKISRPYIMPDERSINIDEKIDFLLAELMLKKIK